MRQARRISSSVALGPGEGDVLADGAVEQERVLQDDAELRPVRLQPDGREVDAVDQNVPCGRLVEGGDQADDRRFARAGGADKRGHGARLGNEVDAVQHRLASVYSKSDVPKLDYAFDGADR